MNVVGKIALVMMMVWMFGNAQLRSLSLDLRNSYSQSVTSQPFGDIRLKNYNQNYTLSLLGYGFQKDILLFDLSTSLSDQQASVNGNGVLQKIRNRNIGFYNLSATILPLSTGPISLYVSKSDAQNNTSYESQFNEIVASYYGPSTFLYQTEVEGIRWNIAKDENLPSIELGYEHNVSNGKMLTNNIEMKNTLFSGQISNSSPDDKNRYSVRYNYTDARNIAFKQNYTNHELQFYGTSKLTEKVDAFSSAFYIDRRNAVSRSMELGGTLVSQENESHQFRVSTSENMSKLAGTYKTTSTNIQYQSQMPVSEHLALTMGSTVNLDRVVINTESLQSDRAQATVQLNHSGAASFFTFEGNYSFSAGEEKHMYGIRRGVYSGQAVMNVTTVSWNSLQWTLRENINIAQSYTFGRIVNNVIRGELSTTYILRTLVQIEGERMDNRSSEYSDVTDRVTHTIGGKFMTGISFNTTINGSFSQSTTQSWYFERTTTANVSIIQNRLIRYLLLQASGEYNRNSFTGIKVLRGEASAVYQFYAFTISLKYLLFSYSGIQTSGVALEIGRPVSFTFE